MTTLSPHCGTEKVTILIYRRNSNVSPVPKPILKSFSFTNTLFSWNSWYEKEDSSRVWRRLGKSLGNCILECVPIIYLESFLSSLSLAFLFSFSIAKFFSLGILNSKGVKGGKKDQSYKVY